MRKAQIAMVAEYAWRGLLGVLTPQANTTVEPEFSVLLPPGVAMICGRMVSQAASMTDRLRDYFAALSPACAQFGNAPLGAIAIACTGASYLVSHARETALIEALESERGVPVITSGRAVLAALAALEARRIAVISPYPQELTAASLRYWRDGGVEPVRVAEVSASQPGFHPVYALQSADARAALEALEAEGGFDAVVLLGTGMPSLQSILDKPRVGAAPVISCNLAAAWRSVLALEGERPSRDNVLAWVDRPEWAGRQRARGKPPGNAGRG